ncbi:MAG: hypothetical protein ACREHE_10570 [Rhizomicrobium sp.]
MDTPGLTQCRRAAAALLALGIYLEAMEWIDLYPWNNIRGGNGQETLDYVIAGVVIALVAWLWRGGRIPALLALAFATFWSWLQLTTWWIPYIEGASPQWQRIYAKWFAGCTQILPATPGHLPPDANHVVLDVLVAIAFVTAVHAAIAAFRTRAARRVP